ncbi:ABC transporter substrate-binding protein [Salipiger sp.]|uniref:ABC transporter substrate-binding protein n=1 Tax=Salipiger sp. TaxID=2078585 RepID=UPI003A96ED33
MGFEDAKTGLTRRDALRMAGAGVAAAVMARPAILRAQGAAGLDEAVEWARANLPATTPDILNAAAAEGKLVLTLQLHGDDEAMKTMITAFNKRYPFIAAEYTLQNSSQVMQKFNAEVGSGRGVSDYIHLPSNLLNTKAYIEAGNLTEFVISNEDLYPAIAKDTGLFYPALEQHGVTCWRDGALSEEEVAMMHTYDGITDPRFKDRIGIVGVSTSNGQAGCYVLMHGPDPSLWDKLVANAPQVKTASSPLTDGLLSGEYDVALMNGFSIAARAAQDGAPLRFGLTNPSPVTFAPGAISALAPNPNAAKVWQDWFNSVEAQDIWVGVSGAMSALAGTKPCWSQQQPWFFENKNGQVPIDWDDFAARQEAVIDTYKSALQAG